MAKKKPHNYLENINTMFGVILVSVYTLWIMNIYVFFLLIFSFLNKSNIISPVLYSVSKTILWRFTLFFNLILFFNFWDWFLHNIKVSLKIINLLLDGAVRSINIVLLLNWNMCKIYVSCCCLCRLSG